MVQFFLQDEFDIHPTAYIAPSARIYGKVKIGAYSSVWDGVVIRGDMAPIEIGKDTSIQENAVVHVDTDTPTFIGSGVTVGHGAIIHGATIEDHCIIAISSTILNDAMVKNYSVIAAGALVREGETIPENSLAVGIPAKVVRQISDSMRESILENARVYVELGKAYIKKLKTH